MKLRKSMMVAGAVTTLGVAGMTGLGAVSAQSDSSGDIVERIASRFNLSQDDVQAVFDEDKADREAELEADFSERLQNRVDDGDITAEQKTLIEEKSAELRNSWEAQREELEAWAGENGIDMRYLTRGGFRGDDRLDEAVEDSDITAEQRTLIENKLDELETEREAARDELEQWAEDNGIDSDLVHGFGGGKRGFGGMQMFK